VHWAIRFGYSDILRYLISTNQKALQVSLSWTQILKWSVQPAPILLLLLELKIVNASVELVQWATKHHQMELLAFVFTELDAALFVDYAACVIASASQFDHLQVLEWLLAKQSATTFSDAALLSDVQWEVASTIASTCGHLHVLQWLHEKGFLKVGTPLVELAAIAVQHGHVAALEWFLSIEESKGMIASSFSSVHLVEAMEKGHVDFIEYMMRTRPGLLDTASRGIHSEVVSFLEMWKWPPRMHARSRISTHTGADSNPRLMGTTATLKRRKFQ
jgi:hypothetical protein